MVTKHVIQIPAVEMPRRSTVTARLGAKLHPTQVTEAWYAADCPPKLDTSSLPRRIRLQWRIACLLRGIKL